MTPDMLTTAQRRATAMREAAELLGQPGPTLADAAEEPITAATVAPRGGPGCERPELN